MGIEADDARVREALAAHSGTEAGQWHLVSKARHGMQVLFETLRSVQGDGEVLTQGLTCCTAVDPIIAAGLVPAYGAVSPRSLALDPEALTASDRTRAIVLQHTFGLVDDAGAAGLRARADRVGALLVEDSAHCVGRLARDAGGRPLADVSVHSFGIEKILPTRFGGAVWIAPGLADTPLGTRLVSALDGLPQAGRRADLLVRGYRTELRVLTHLPAPVARPLRRMLTDAGLFEPAVADVERRGGVSRRPMRPSALVLRQVAAGLAGLDANERLRRRTVTVYRRELGRVPGVELPELVREDPVQPLLRLPLLVADTARARRLIAELRDAGLYATDWYRPALYPGVTDPTAYRYDPAASQNRPGERIIARILNLPTDVGPNRARAAVEVIARSAATPGD